MRTESEENGDAREGTLPPRLTSRTGFLLSALGRTSREATERALAPLAIKPHHYGVLVVLDALGPAPQHDVGARLRIDKSSMTVFVDHLDRLGLVERGRNPKDRRAYELRLTDAGRDVLAAADPLVERVEGVVLAPLDGEERARLRALLLKLLSGAPGSSPPRTTATDAPAGDGTG